jgi:hypothetical protein
MKRTLLPVNHHPGRHCASTALCNLVNFHGIAFSEAMCFGIGAGLGIWYLDTGSLKPGRMIHVRSADIETQFFTRIGCAFSWQHFSEPMDAQKALCGSLDKGLPAVVQTDIYHLPYYRSKTHFPGHDITVWGYDPAEGVFLITDTERTGLLSVPFEDMRRALYSKNGFFTMEGNQFSPESLAPPQDLSSIIRGAIAHNSRVILSEGYDFQGITGLEKLMREIKGQWPHLSDWQWTARFAYQVIERRGTGGGGFRLMYADFLEEAEAFCPEIASRGLSERMREVGLAWTALSLAFKDASEQARPDFSAVDDPLRQVHRLEAAYHREAQTLGQ